MGVSFRYKKLFGNMALFTIGNFVSKLLVMLLVPFYTNVLSTAEYGIADGMQATLLLLVPLLTINIGEAALRFGLERTQKSSKQILKILVKYVGIADFIVLVACAVAAFFTKDAWPSYFLLFAGLFICNSIYESMILYCQGFEKVQIMVAGSIICTILVIASNLLFLLILKIGLLGYLFSQMIAFAGAALFMLIFMKMSITGADATVAEDGELEYEMSTYGKNMLVYSTSSWINNAIDRYFVLFMCGAAANGLYAVAYKIPAILTVFQRIFAQAWQISANITYDNEDAPKFFAQVYRGYQTIMVVGCAGLVLIVKLVALLLFQKDFFEAWRLVPPLLISVIFGALTGFLGSICLAYKDGRSMGKATGIGAAVNIALNLILIKLMGPMGAAIATMISYYTMYEIAYHMVKRHVDMGINRRLDFVAYLLIMVQSAFVVFELSYWQLVTAVCFVMIMVIYGKSFAGIVISKLKR